MFFPIPVGMLLADFATGGRRFGARRDDGKRKHAGCDLVCPEGTSVYAIDEGTVTRIAPFFRGTYSVEIDHGWCLARYCEIDPTHLSVGPIMEGAIVGITKRMLKDTMLHFELYAKGADGQLTQRKLPPYQRRADLVDPTPWLRSWLWSSRP